MAAPSLTLRQVRAFLAVAAAGRVSRAASELALSPSAVSEAVGELEELLGHRLFERTTRGMRLTPEGARFVEHARNVVAAVDGALRARLAPKDEVEGRVRVGVTYTVAGYFLPAHLARFARLFPKIEVELVEAPRPEIERRLAEGELELAVLLTSNLVDRARLQHETLIRSRRRLWLPTGHRLAALATVPLEEVAQERYVMLTVDEAELTARRYWARTPWMPKVVFRTSSVEAVRSMVATGMGVTILSDMVYRPWSLEGLRLETRDVAEPVPTMDVGLAWRRGAEPGPAARALRDFLGYTFNAAGQSLAG